MLLLSFSSIFSLHTTTSRSGVDNDDDALCVRSSFSFLFSPEKEKSHSQPKQKLFVRSQSASFTRYFYCFMLFPPFILRFTKTTLSENHRFDVNLYEKGGKKKKQRL